MPPGPPKKPTALKLIQGTAHRNKARLNPNEPQPQKFVRPPGPPKHLSAEAKAEWRRVVKELHATGVLTKIDVTALANYCMAFSDMIRAKGLLEQWNRDNPKLIDVQETMGGMWKTHPYVLQLREARRDMMRFAQEFGLTPASRTRVSGVSKKEDNPFSDLGGKT